MFGGLSQGRTQRPFPWTFILLANGLRNSEFLAYLGEFRDRCFDIFFCVRCGDRVQWMILSALRRMQDVKYDHIIASKRVMHNVWVVRDYKPTDIFLFSRPSRIGPLFQDIDRSTDK